MNDLSWIEIVYWASAIIGGTLFVLRTALMLLGGGLGDGDVDTDLHTDFDMDLHLDADGHYVGDHGDVHDIMDAGFKLLTLQGLTAFFMMFGLVGLALLKAGLAVPITAVGGVAAGMFTVWVITMLFRQARRLQSEGTLNIQNAIGEKGTVYLSIPAEGTGQVQVAIQGALRIMDAVAQGGERIETKSKIRVVGVADNKTLIVEKV